MARQVDSNHLAKVAMEGFGMLDEPQRRFGRIQAHQYQHVYQTPTYFVVYKVPPKTETVIDSKQAASMYGGVSVVDYTRKKTHRRWAF